MVPQDGAASKERRETIKVNSIYGKPFWQAILYLDDPVGSVRRCLHAHRTQAAALKCAAIL